MLLAPEDRFCELKPIIQRSRVPFAPPHTAWRLSVSYWKVMDAPAEAPVSKARQALGREALEALIRQPLAPMKPQQPLDIGLFEFRAPENPGLVLPDE